MLPLLIILIDNWIYVCLCMCLGMQEMGNHLLDNCIHMAALHLMAIDLSS